MLWPSESACGSKEFNAPFPVSPSGGKPGRAGSPHAGSTLLASKGGWQASMLPAPPTRGLPPPCGSPASAVLVQTAVSIKPELSIWLTTGTFYLALIGDSGLAGCFSFLVSGYWRWMARCRRRLLRALCLCRLCRWLRLGC